MNLNKQKSGRDTKRTKSLADQGFAQSVAGTWPA